MDTDDAVVTLATAADVDAQLEPFDVDVENDAALVELALELDDGDDDELGIGGLPSAASSLSPTNALDDVALVAASDNLLQSKLVRPLESGIAPPKRRSLPSPGGSTIATGRLGMAARTAPSAALDKRIRRSTAAGSTPIAASTAAAAAPPIAIAGTSDTSNKAVKLSVTESRRAHALAMRARIAAAAEEKKRLAPTPATKTTPRKAKSTRRVLSTQTIPEDELELRRSSFGSQSSSCSSLASSIASSTASAVSAATSTSTNGTASHRLNRPKSAGATSTSSFSNIADRYATSGSSTLSAASRNSSTGLSASSTAAMKKLLATGTMLPVDITQQLDATLIENLKSQHVTTDKGVSELLRTMASSSKARSSDDVKQLKTGLQQLQQHAQTLMAACDAWGKRSLHQHDELEHARSEIARLLNVLADDATNDTTLALFPDDPAALALVDADQPIEEPIENDNSSDHSSNNSVEPTVKPVVAPLKPIDSPLTKYVNDMMQRATDQIEAKWKARFAEQATEHAQALALERARSSASVISTSRRVAETKHETEDAFYALKETNSELMVANKHLQGESDALKRELDFLKSLLDAQDEARSSSTFWQKTTDLAKANRALTEDKTQLEQTVATLTESIKRSKDRAQELQLDNFDRVTKCKQLEMDQQLLSDKLLASERNADDEKLRREQFQVCVEQLTVENTALYAQMVALQTTHDAKMEELRARTDKRATVLAGELRLLQTQNRLLRAGGGGEYTGHHHPISSVSVSSSSVTYDEDDDGELSDRLKDMTEELINCRQELSEKVDFVAELEWRINESELIRRKLHNTIQELRGNIRVHVRLRPFLRSDGAEAASDTPQPSIRADAFSSTVLTNTEKPHRFSFDKIYGQSDSQEFVFNDVADFIQSAMDGYNVCIFAYGQTGSGKTHTMQGSGKAQMRGIIPRSIQLIIRCCQELSTQGWHYTLDVTFYEIYNETIRDLLAMDANDNCKFAIRTDKRGKNYVDGLQQRSIDFAIAEAQVEEIVNLAARNRSVDKTDMNAHSSRSHSIFALTIRGVNELQTTEVEGTLSLVDLAGSERLSRSNATGDRLKEAQAINKSLSALADVFQALAKKAAHVPYRNSKLTYVLQPALSGDGKTLMMVNLSPTFASLDESLCSLRFAQNVSQCELGAPARQIKSRLASATSMPNSSSNSSSSNNVQSVPITVSSVATAPGSTSSNARNSPARIPSTRTRASTTITPIAKKLFQ